MRPSAFPLLAESSKQKLEFARSRQQTFVKSGLASPLRVKLDYAADDVMSIYCLGTKTPIVVAGAY